MTVHALAVPPVAPRAAALRGQLDTLRDRFHALLGQNSNDADDNSGSNVENAERGLHSSDASCKSGVNVDSISSAAAVRAAPSALAAPLQQRQQQQEPSAYPEPFNAYPQHQQQHQH